MRSREVKALMDRRKLPDAACFARPLPTTSAHRIDRPHHLRFLRVPASPRETRHVWLPAFTPHLRFCDSCGRSDCRTDSPNDARARREKLEGKAPTENRLTRGRRPGFLSAVAPHRPGRCDHGLNSECGDGGQAASEPGHDSPELSCSRTRYLSRVTAC